MKRLSRKEMLLVTACFFLFVPVVGQAQSEGPPPIGQQLVREGDFAVKLVSALGIEKIEDEIEAESRLGAVGVLPRNGWIADYPVTPDIIGELQKSVGDAADGNKLTLGKNEALNRLNDVTASFGLAVIPYTGGQIYGAESSGSQNYPNPQVIDSYYYDQGPPVVTYYYPPPGFYYLYAWVPFPFWCSGFWFPGFFILHDFHRAIIINRRVVFVSNHFNDVKSHRVFRIDPVARFNGRTFAGIGVRSRKGFISTGVRHSETRIFHGPREHMPAGANIMNPLQRNDGVTRPSTGAIRPVVPQAGAAASPSPGEGRSIRPPVREGKARSPGMHEEEFRGPTREGRGEIEPPAEGNAPGPPTSHEGETVRSSTGGGARR